MKKTISVGITLVLILLSQLMQVSASTEHSTTYKFAMIIDGSDYITSEDEMFRIHGCRSYGDIQNTGYLGNDTVYTQGSCTIEVLCGELTIFRVDNWATIYESIDPDTYSVNSKNRVYLDNMQSAENITYFLEDGTYILDMYSGGMGTACRLIVGSGVFGTHSSETELDDRAQELHDFWFENYSSIRPFGEYRKPESAFVSDIDNDTKPELLVYFSYLGPGGPTIAVYKNNDGHIYHENSITTSSGTGIHHNLSLIMEKNGDIKISDHYMDYTFGDLGAQSISLMHYNAGNCVTEEYAAVSYLDEISYSQDVNGENRTYCTIYEANNFFDTVYKRINHNVVFSSESNTNQGNVCFEIWKKQTELRKQITVLLMVKKSFLINHQLLLRDVH